MGKGKQGVVSVSNESLNGWTVLNKLRSRSSSSIICIAIMTWIIEKNEETSGFEAFGRLEQDMVNNALHKFMWNCSSNLEILVLGSWIL